MQYKPQPRCLLPRPGEPTGRRGASPSQDHATWVREPATAGRGRRARRPRRLCRGARLLRLCSVGVVWVGGGDGSTLPFQEGDVYGVGPRAPVSPDSTGGPRWTAMEDLKQIGTHLAADPGRTSISPRIYIHGHEVGLTLDGTGRRKGASHGRADLYGRPSVTLTTVPGARLSKALAGW